MKDQYIPWVNDPAELRTIGNDRFDGATIARASRSLPVTGVESHFLWTASNMCNTHPAYIKANRGLLPYYYGYDRSVLDVQTLIRQKAINSKELLSLHTLLLGLVDTGLREIKDLEYSMKFEPRICNLFADLTQIINADEQHVLGTGISPYADGNVPDWDVCIATASQIGGDIATYQTARGACGYVMTLRDQAQQAANKKPKWYER